MHSTAGRDQHNFVPCGGILWQIVSIFKLQAYACQLRGQLRVLRCVCRMLQPAANRQLTILRGANRTT